MVRHRIPALAILFCVGFAGTNTWPATPAKKPPTAKPKTPKAKKPPAPAKSCDELEKDAKALLAGLDHACKAHADCAQLDVKLPCRLGCYELVNRKAAAADKKLRAAVESFDAADCTGCKTECLDLPEQSDLLCGATGTCIDARLMLGR
jgi:hypothetical protein